MESSGPSSLNGSLTLVYTWICICVIMWHSLLCRLIKWVLAFPTPGRQGQVLAIFISCPTRSSKQALSRNPLTKGPCHVHLLCLCQHPHLFPPQPTGRKLREELSSFRDCWWPSIFPTSQLEHCSIFPSHRPGHKGWGICSRRAPVIMHLCMKQQPLHHL